MDKSIKNITYTSAIDIGTAYTEIKIPSLNLHDVHIQE